MPYHTLKDLPENVRHVLPLHAQEIYRGAYNSAHEEYKDKSKRNDPAEDLEEACHRIAWSAVKKKYEKNKKGEWVESS
jgi:cation transport regulator